MKNQLVRTARHSTVLPGPSHAPSIELINMLNFKVAAPVFSPQTHTDLPTELDSASAFWSGGDRGWQPGSRSDDAGL